MLYVATSFMNLHFLKKPLQPLFSALAVAWLIYGYYRYLSSPTWEVSNQLLDHFGAVIAPDAVVDILIILGLWAASDFLGDRLLGVLGVRLNSGAERLALASAAGLAVLSLGTTILTLANLLYRAAAWTLVSVPVVLWLWRRTTASSEPGPPQGSRTNQVRPSRLTAQEIAAVGRNQHAAIVPSWQGTTGKSIKLGQRVAHGFLLAYTGTALTVTLLSALGPPLEYDDVAYHLDSGKTYIQKHRFQALPLNPVTFMPKNVEMLYALAMLLHNEITAKLVHYLMGLLTMLAAYGLGARLFSPTAGLAAMAILASSPLFLWEMRTVHIDVGLALYVFLSLYATLLWLSTKESGWFKLIFCFLAFGLGIKYHALFALGSLCLLIFLSWTVSYKNPGKGFKVGFTLFLASSAGLLIPWGAVNLYFTGNPVFPLLHDLFHSRYWTPELSRVIFNQQNDAGIPLALANWRDWLNVLWTLFISEPGKFKGNLGPFFLLLLPLFLFQRRVRPEAKLIFAFSSIYGFLWLLTAQHARYLLAVLPGLAVLSGIALTGWLGLCRGRVAQGFAWAVSVVLALMAMFNLPFFEHAGPRYGSTIMATLPLQYLLGLESKDQYLARHIENYPAVQFFNQLSGPKHLLFWWNTHPPIYYVKGPASYLFTPFVPKLFGEDPAEIHGLLKQNGVTHLVTGRVNQDAHLITRPEGEFTRTYLKRVFQKNASVLYEVASAPLNQEVVYYDFLTHIGEASIRMPSEPAGKPNTAYRVVAGGGGDSRYSLLAFPPAEVEYSLSLCEQPVLQFAVGQTIPNCSGKGSFEIWLAEAAGNPQRIYSRELYAEKSPRDAGWFEERLDLSAFASKQIKITFKTRHLEGGSCAWYCWADPVVLSKPLTK
ncbi:MAG: glycosyltransferase family 39 protein [Acidobacteria bacterium]|nr:glycosyltransferase family 39 protein [Acidobacteriota bacterium]MCI0722340.1 glycosyltransferase family 39 protein [Acidobacteriota bacterium]